MIIIYSIVSMAGIICALTTRNFSKDQFAQLDEKEEPLRFLYPTVAFLYYKCLQRFMGQRNRKLEGTLQMLDERKSKLPSYEKYMIKKLSFVYLIIVSVSLLSICIEVQSLQKNQKAREGILMRPAGEISEKMKLDMEVMTDDQWRKDELNIELKPYCESTDSKPIERKVDEGSYQRAYEYIDSVVLKENSDLNHIVSDLYLPYKVPELGIDIEWSVEGSKRIDRSGHIQIDDLNEPEEAILLGRIKKGEEILGNYQIRIVMIPKNQYEYEQWRNGLKLEIEKLQENDKNGRMIKLPTEYAGKKIRWRAKREFTSLYLFGIGILSSIFIHITMEEEIENKVRRRKKQMLVDYTDILNKLALLIGAGMTLPSAWQRIVLDYQKMKKQESKKKKKDAIRYAYEEMMITNSELHLGESNTRAIEEFGRRTQVMEYRKLSTVLIQNMKKGTDGLTHILELMATEAFEARKQRAKQLGEEAGTKLLLPMMIMLVLVLIIIMVPAFWSMKL